MTQAPFPWKVEHDALGSKVRDASGEVLFFVNDRHRTRDAQREIAEYVARTCNAAHDSAAPVVLS